MDFSGLTLVKLSSTTLIKPFDCGTKSLNNFLLNKAIKYHEGVLATTYILESEAETIAYFSIFNDSFAVEEKDFASATQWEKFKQGLIPFGKRHLDNFPAIKIGRLAVCKDKKLSGIGRSIMDFIIDLALSQNEKCACKYIIVDAKRESTGYYEKMKFLYFTEKDKDKDEREMYFDLTPLLNTEKEIEQQENNAAA